jgi:hypothetical protein
MREKRADVAQSLVDHALDLCAGLEVICEAVPGLDLAAGYRGEFSFAHSRPNHYIAEEIVDVWWRPHGKVLWATRRKGAIAWEVRTFKRGDWEMGFLLTSPPTDARPLQAG